MIYLSMPGAATGLELIEVVVHEGAVTLALIQHMLHVGGVLLVLHDPDGHSAVMQRDEPCPAWLHACMAWAACTLQHLDPDGVFAAHAVLIALAARPVAPAHDIVEILLSLQFLREHWDMRPMWLEAST